MGGARLLDGGARLLPRWGGPRWAAAAEGGGARKDPLPLPLLLLVLLLLPGPGRGGYPPGLNSWDCCVCWPMMRCRGGAGGGIKEEEFRGEGVGTGCCGGSSGGGGIVADSFLATFAVD